MLSQEFLKAAHGPSSFLQPESWRIEQDTSLFSPFALLPIAACLTYLAPACVAAQMGRLWHVLIFSVMAILGAVSQACDAGSQLQLGGYVVCSDSTQERLGLASGLWAHFCFLQVCWVVLGPEDPWLHRGNGSGLAKHIGDLPVDVLIFVRALPLVALTLSLSLRDRRDWQHNLLLDNMLLFFGCVSWWLGSATRRAQASDILIRLRFWARVGLRLLLPALLLLPVALAAEALHWRVLSAARHAGCAAIATVALADVFGGKADMGDHALQNRLIVPWILVLTSLVFMATVLGAFGVDGFSCNHALQWPTLATVAAAPGGHFVLTFMTPLLLLSMSATVWVLDASPVVRPPTFAPTNFWSPWGRRLPWRLPSVPKKLRATCRWLGCRLLNTAMALGAVGWCCLDHSVLHMAVAVPFFVSLWLAVILCTASADNSTLFGLLRFIVTIAIAKGMLILLLLFAFANQYVHNTFLLRPSLYAVTEYAVLICLALWPLAWIEDARAVRDPASASMAALSAQSISTRAV